jgi:hypothetical protein
LELTYQSQRSTFKKENKEFGRVEKRQLRVLGSGVIVGYLKNGNHKKSRKFDKNSEK